MGKHLMTVARKKKEKFTGQLPCIERKKNGENQIDRRRGTQKHRCTAIVITTA